MEQRGCVGRNGWQGDTVWEIRGGLSADQLREVSSNQFVSAKVLQQPVGGHMFTPDTVPFFPTKILATVYEMKHS